MDGGRSFGVRRCSFRGTRACNIEWDEWVMVRALVTPEHTVLEVGARFGTTSCMLAAATNNTGRVISVEPDYKVHRYLLANRDAHCCAFHVVQGTVATRPLVLNRASRGYNQRTRPASPNASSASGALPNFDVAQVERAVGHRINAALIDCEGCMDYVLSDDLLSRLELLLIEEDQRDVVDYPAWHAKLRARGFRRAWYAKDTYDADTDIVHSAWIRGRRRVPSCDEFAARAGLPPQALRCITHYPGSI